MENKKSIGNVNILHLANATEETLAGMGTIGNINVVFFTPETARLIPLLKSGNINQTFQLPAGIKIIQNMGQVRIARDYFTHWSAQNFLVTMGQVIVDPEVPPEEITTNLAGFVIMGQLICPESLFGVFTSKPNLIMGQTITYPAFKHIHHDQLTLDEDYLSSLNDQSEIAVIGSLCAPKVLPNGLLEQKIGKIYVNGTVECHAENAQVIRSRLFKGSGSVKIIPAGFELIEKPLTLDAETLGYLPSPNLFCKDQVTIAAGVDPAVLDHALSRLVVKGLLISPASLKPVLARKMDLFDTQAVFYEGELLLVADQQTLYEARLSALKSRAALVVTGELTIDPGITAAVLSSKINSVHNFGMIQCTPEQRPALESCLVHNEGQIKSEPEGEEEADENQMGNVNYLVL
ncbi:MAG TPA: hypothetical protein VIO61_01940 [Anaerolineaceae bacterium]